MLCPYCNNEMELGYIDQTDFRFQLEWYPAKRENVGIFASKKRNVRLSNGGNVKAYRCDICKKLIIAESDLNA